MDKHHGNSGTYLVKDGQRELVEGSQTRPHPEGDAPRDEDGKRVDRDAAQAEQARPQPALPEPAKTAPWEAPAETAKPAEEPSSSSRKRGRGDN